MSVRVNFGRALIAAAALILFAAAPPFLHAEDMTDFKKETVMVQMPDSTMLATDIYMPSTDGKYPAVLSRMPYGTENMAWLAKGLASNGFVVVLQNVRGTNGSTGQFFPFVYDKQDGMATVEWILQQEWCNGKLGLWGGSYSGFAAFEIASTGHPAVASIVNLSGWSDLEPFLTHNGAFQLQAHLPWFIIFGSGQQAPPKEVWDGIFRSTPLSSFFPGTEAVSGMAGMEYDYCAITAPALHITGWYDYIYPNVLETYEEINRCSDGETLQNLIIGPWAHNDVFNGVTKVGDEDFGDNARTDSDWVLAKTLEWYNHTLKNQENGLESRKPVRVFVMRSNEWIEFDSWPPENTEEEILYIDRTKETGLLSEEPPQEESYDQLTYDPNNPVPTVGGANSHFFPDNLGPRDQSDVEGRPDVLVYTASPAVIDYLIVGPIQANIQVASSAEDTDITAKLTVVREDGYVRNIEDGILRASYAFDTDGASGALIPGEVYRFDIGLGATAVQIYEGERLRLEISGGNFPKYDRNPNTGESSFDAVEFQPVEQTIYHSPGYPTHILVPILAVQ